MKSIFSSLAILLGAWTACAQSYHLDWSTLEPSGTGSSRGGFNLEGIVGQPDAGALAGGGFVIFGGHLTAAGAGGQIQPTAVLRARLAGPGAISLSWPAALSGFTLQQSTALHGSLSWSAVPVTPSLNGADYYVTLLLDTRLQFFRLSKP